MSRTRAAAVGASERQRVGRQRLDDRGVGVQISFQTPAHVGGMRGNPSVRPLAKPLAADSLEAVCGLAGGTELICPALRAGVNAGSDQLPGVAASFSRFGERHILQHAERYQLALTAKAIGEEPPLSRGGNYHQSYRRLSIAQVRRYGNRRTGPS